MGPVGVCIAENLLPQPEGFELGKTKYQFLPVIHCSCLLFHGNHDIPGRTISLDFGIKQDLLQKLQYLLLFQLPTYHFSHQLLMLF